MKKALVILIAAVLVFVLAAPVRAQESPAPAPGPAAQAAAPAQAAPVVAATPPPASAPAQTAPTPAPRPAPPVLRTELIRLKYADIETVATLLRGFQSQYGRVVPAGRAENAVVVTDTPEIVDKMLAVVRDVDVKPAEIQYAVQLVQGSDAETAGDESLKNDPVIRELRGVLRYKSFSLLDGTLMRVIDGGEAEAKIGPNGEYAIRLRPKYTKDGTAETIQTEIRLRKPQWVSQQTTNAEKKEETRSMQMYYNELIGTTLLLRAGEKTVVGVSKTDADRGLILILSGKVVK